MFNINPYKNKTKSSSTSSTASPKSSKTASSSSTSPASSSSSSSTTSSPSSTKILSSNTSPSSTVKEKRKKSFLKDDSIPSLSSKTENSLSLTSLSEITQSMTNTQTQTPTDASMTAEDASEIGEDYDPFLSILEDPNAGEGGGGIEKETTEELQEMLAVLKGVQNECNVLLLGRTGVGKSSTLNTVFGIDIPVHSSESCTQDPFTYSRVVNGFKLNIIDTPGFLDSQGELVDSNNMIKIQRYLSGKTIHCVLFVEKFTETRFDGAHQQVINQFTEKLGPQLWRNAAVVLTYANSVLPDSCYDGFDEEDDIGPWKKHYEARAAQFRKFFTGILSQLPQDDSPPKHIPIYAMENSRRCKRNEQGQRILIDGTPCLHLLISGLLKMVDPKTAFLFMGHLRAKNKPGRGHRGDQNDRELSIMDNITEILKLFIVPPFDQLGKGTVAKILENWGKKLDKYGNLPNLLKI